MKKATYPHGRVAQEFDILLKTELCVLLGLKVDE